MIFVFILGAKLNTYIRDDALEFKGVKHHQQEYWEWVGKISSRLECFGVFQTIVDRLTYEVPGSVLA